MTAKPGLIVTVLYKKTPELQFDLDYYHSQHIPLAMRLWQPYGLIDAYTVQPTEESEFALGVTMNWKSLEAWEEAQKNEAEVGEIMEDVKKFTNGTPIFVVGKVVG